MQKLYVTGNFWLEKIRLDWLFKYLKTYPQIVPNMALYFGVSQKEIIDRWINGEFDDDDMANFM